MSSQFFHFFKGAVNVLLIFIFITVCILYYLEYVTLTEIIIFTVIFSILFTVITSHSLGIIKLSDFLIVSVGIVPILISSIFAYIIYYFLSVYIFPTVFFMKETFYDNGIKIIIDYYNSLSTEIKDKIKEVYTNIKIYKDKIKTIINMITFLIQGNIEMFYQNFIILVPEGINFFKEWIKDEITNLQETVVDSLTTSTSLPAEIKNDVNSIISHIFSL